MPSIPKNVRVVAMCLAWYISSMLTSNSSKLILSKYDRPLSLTLIKFGFVSTICYFASRYKYTDPLRSPSLKIIRSSAALSLFQTVGHILSSTALSYVSVSFSQTIKALSPLFTVITFSFISKTNYSPQIYLSMVPLTLGVVLVCSYDMSFTWIGLSLCLISTAVFVSQTIYSKTVLSNSDSTVKLDKINLLFYSYTVSFVFTVPLWLIHDMIPFLSSPPGLYLMSLYILNGFTHFMQSFISMAILTIVSPVTHTIGSLIKRIFVIVSSILFFGDRITPLQAFGIGLTSIGLFMYDRAKIRKTFVLPTAV